MGSSVSGRGGIGRFAAILAMALIATLGAYARPPIAHAATSPFTDIAGTTFEADIDWLYAEGVTVGCTATLYCPERTVTRGEMASFLSRMFDLPATTTDFFTDDDGTTHESEINELAAAEITVGCTATTFCPKAAVRRDEMASFLARAIPLSDGVGDNYFRDDSGTTHEANIDRAAAAGITTGCGTWRYCPSSSVTRGQMAGFLHRIENPVSPPPHPAPSGPLHVATTGSDTANDCLALAKPCRTIAHAIAEAWPGETIRVAAGTYNEPRFIVDKDLHIAGDESGGTVLDATSSVAHEILEVAENRNVELANLTLTGGVNEGFYGGAITSYGNLTIIDSTIRHNRAPLGGAIWSLAGTLTIIGSTLSDNQATVGDGGAIMYRGDLTIINTTLVGNEATQGGGGGIAPGGCAGSSCPLDVLILNSTITGNAGGGVYSDPYGHTTIRNSIVAGNTAGSRAADFLDGGGTETVLDSIIGIPTGLTLADILDPDGLQDNGGPTKTIALTDAGTNPARHHGDTATCAGDPVNGVDQRGLPRTAPCDIGAYELQP